MMVLSKPIYKFKCSLYQNPSRLSFFLETDKFDPKIYTER